MTTPHKHQATINAWAAGAQIQWRINDHDAWEDIAQPGWYLNHQYRIKNKHQDCIDAHEAGEIIEAESGDGSYWAVVFEPAWQPGCSYRISPRSAELKKLIEAHKAGKQLQRRSGHVWVDTEPTWSSLFEYRIKDKFADLKQAFAEGKLIEAFDANLEEFRVNLRPTWDEGVEHRLCPRQDELKPVIAAHLEGKQIEFFQRSFPGWFECVRDPLWQASHDYRVKTRWQKELDAWRAGKKIECRRTDRTDTWDVQVTGDLDYYLLNPNDRLEYRVKPDAIAWPKELDAYLKGAVIQSGGSGVWYDQQRSPELEQELRDGRLRMKVRVKHKWQDCIDAWERGEAVQVGTSDGRNWLLLDHETEPAWLEALSYRIKPDTLKSKRYVFNRKGKPSVGICSPSNQHDVPSSTFVRWVDDDWVETEV